MDVIQLLPLNDTGQETSPYSALSAFALNPVHLRLADLHETTPDPVLKKILYSLQHPKNKERVDYPSVRKLKDEFLRRYIDLNQSEITAEPGFQAFCNSMPWLETYALYRTLKEKHSWLSWEDWPEEFRIPTLKLLSTWKKKFCHEMAYHQIVQYLCYSQFWEVRAHAERHGIYLKGDIPILLNRDSADVWRYRSLFDLNLCAGAPPDFYSSEGQNWGVPLYRWDSEERQPLFNWWKERLQCAESLYHLYRLDHIVGFFRIWAVPPNHIAREGHFIPSEWTSWIPCGEKILRELLAATKMLPIGEDLGAVPPNIKSCLARLGICGTKVMRWERDWDGDGHFIDGKLYSPISMTTVSTHDSETLRQWWRDFPEDSQRWCREKGWSWGMKLTPEQHWKFLEESHRTNSLFHVNLLSEYLEVFPDWNWSTPEQNRVNVPGTVTDRNWSVKLLPSVEEIVEHRGLKSGLQQLLKG